MIWTLVLLILILWVLGYGVWNLGNVVHLLLVVVLIIVISDWIRTHPRGGV